MNTNDIELKVMEEIKQIPEERLSEVYDFIHFFRLGLGATGNNDSTIMQFAGIWADMSDQELDDFLNEIKSRRIITTSRRTANEANIS